MPHAVLTPILQVYTTSTPTHTPIHTPIHSRIYTRIYTHISTHICPLAHIYSILLDQVIELAENSMIQVAESCIADIDVKDYLFNNIQIANQMVLLMESAISIKESVKSQVFYDNCCIKNRILYIQYLLSITK